MIRKYQLGSRVRLFIVKKRNNLQLGIKGFTINKYGFHFSVSLIWREITLKVDTERAILYDEWYQLSPSPREEFLKLYNSPYCNKLTVKENRRLIHHVRSQHAAKSDV